MSQTVEPWISCSPSVRSACASTRARVAERKGIAERQHGQAKCTTCRSRFICKYGDIFGTDTSRQWRDTQRAASEGCCATHLPYGEAAANTKVRLGGTIDGPRPTPDRGEGPARRKPGEKLKCFVYKTCIRLHKVLARSTL